MDASARDARLAPVDALLSTFAPVRLDREAARRFQQGQRLRLGELPPIGADAHSGEARRVRVYRDEDGALLGVATAGNGVLAPERLVVSSSA
jgi:tRNA pseudouridine55 synthase